MAQTFPPRKIRELNGSIRTNYLIWKKGESDK